jgi:hypothetical protein
LYEYTVKVLAKSAIALSARNLDPKINGTFKEENYVPCFKMRGNLLKF